MSCLSLARALTSLYADFPRWGNEGPTRQNRTCWKRKTMMMTTTKRVVAQILIPGTVTGKFWLEFLSSRYVPVPVKIKMIPVTYLEGIYRLSTLRFAFYREVSRFIRRCIEGLNSLVVLRTALKFVSFICTNNTVEINNLKFAIQYLSSECVYWKKTLPGIHRIEDFTQDWF